ncbi:MAG TPA: hypothetical protein VNB24_05500 [Acidimicrobiales bacterium]|nr:hypothetical protein [Acidimicrobiales bacterium]
MATANRGARTRSSALTAPGRPATSNPGRNRQAAETRPKLKVVATPVAVPRVRRAVVVVALLFGVVLLFGVAASHVVLAQNQSKLDSLDKRARSAQATYAKLRYQVAELESPERVVAEAQRRLGMVSPVEVTYVNAPPAPASNGDAVAATAGGTVETSAGDWRRVKAELAGR